MNIDINIVSIPSMIWEKHLSSLVSDALVCERRIIKESNIDVERSRYHLFCSQIESWAKKWLMSQSLSSTFTLHQNYLIELHYLLEEIQKNGEHLGYDLNQARITASFIPPEGLHHYIKSLDSILDNMGSHRFPNFCQRISFLKQVLKEKDENGDGPGIVEFQIPFTIGTQTQPDQPIILLKKDKTKPHTNVKFQFDEKAKNVNLYQSLQNNIDVSLLTGEGVNFSNPTHIVITEVLHNYIYQRNSENVSSIRVCYSDGSEAAPFPLRQLGIRSHEKVHPILCKKPINAALISMRHLEMDSHVHISWFLNQQASRPRFFADTDTFCYETTHDLLKQINKPILLHLYQTGLQPAVVGFYRALVEWYQESDTNRDNLVVVPMYHQIMGGYKQGKYWN